MTLYNDPISYNAGIPYNGLSGLANIFTNMVSAADVGLRNVHQYTVTYYAGGVGNGVSIVVMIATSQPELITQTTEGRDDRQDIYLNVRVVDVPTPNRGDKYVITDAGYAGSYLHMNIEKRNPVRWLIRCTSDHLSELGAEKARETRQ